MASFLYLYTQLHTEQHFNRHSRCNSKSIRGVSKKFARGRQIRGVRWVDFFMCPRLKSIMKGASFADVAAIQERVTAVLRSIPKEGFTHSF
jgi:hypothetical protein